MESMISVIIPVYRTETYLNRCISSVVNQTYKNIEIILVDDGSPDDCPNICDEWSKKDKRIRVIHQKNLGGGAARNAALDIVKGDFIAFVDSDDYIAPAMLEFLVGQFQGEVDIVECSYCNTDSDLAEFDDIKSEYEQQQYSSFDAVRENIRDHIFRQLIWNKMYRREMIGDIRFPVGTKIDDEFWTYRVIGNARKLVYTNKVLYAYRQQENSVMHSLDAEKRLQALTAKKERYDYICKRMPELQEECLYNLWCLCIYQGQLILRTKNCNVEYDIWNELKNTIKEYPFDIVKQTGLCRMQIIWLMMARLNLKVTCWIRNGLKIGL